MSFLFSFREILTTPAPPRLFSLLHTPQVLAGLLFLLFCVYTILQQRQIHWIRHCLTGQIAALNQMEAHATEIYQMAVLDPLTGLNNRRSGERRLREEM